MDRYSGVPENWDSLTREMQRQILKKARDDREQALSEIYKDVREMELPLLAKGGGGYASCPYFHAVSAQSVVTSSQLPEPFARLETTFIKFLKPTMFVQLAEVCEQLRTALSYYHEFFLVSHQESKALEDMMTAARPEVCSLRLCKQHVSRTQCSLVSK